jgi:NAD+ synthase (glutamine-hydrolysing)
MKVLLCQINTTPGDFTGNVKKITAELEAHGKDDIDVIVFPELTIPGYLCKDLMFEKDFVTKNLAGLTHICETYNHIHPYIIVGYIDANNTGHGKPFRNMLAVIKDGMIVGIYQKRLLPFYDVFDEGRYFEPGKENLVLNICGQKVGMAICEDVWQNCKGETGLYNYETNPVTQHQQFAIRKGQTSLPF